MSEPSDDPLTEQQLTEEVCARIAAADPRLTEVMRSLVRHLHAFACDVRLTQQEWQVAIGFLTAAGHLTDDKRQEFVLLSDTLGLSSLVDILEHGADRTFTESTVLGPFYVGGSPWRDDGANIAIDDPGGQPTHVSGVVRGADGSALAGAVLDIWQTGSQGIYAVQDASQPEDNLRGRFRTDRQGRYSFRTVRPVPYAIPNDGPVGQMLAATGRHPWRAAHIHAIVSAPDYETLTTHIFDAGSDYLDSDTVFGVKPSLIREFVTGDDGVARVEMDFTLRPEQAV
jgi:protocatechuate 3,4-dioxygenase beta subunit